MAPADVQPDSVNHYGRPFIVRRCHYCLIHSSTRPLALVGTGTRTRTITEEESSHKILMIWETPSGTR